MAHYVTYVADVEALAVFEVCKDSTAWKEVVENADPDWGIEYYWEGHLGVHPEHIIFEGFSSITLMTLHIKYSRFLFGDNIFKVRIESFNKHCAGFMSCHFPDSRVLVVDEMLIEDFEKLSSPCGSWRSAADGFLRFHDWLSGQSVDYWREIL